MNNQDIEIRIAEAKRGMINKINVISDKLYEPIEGRLKEFERRFRCNTQFKITNRIITARDYKNLLYKIPGVFDVYFQIIPDHRPNASFMLRSLPYQYEFLIKELEYDILKIINEVKLITLSFELIRNYNSDSCLSHILHLR